MNNIIICDHAMIHETVRINGIELNDRIIAVARTTMVSVVSKRMIQEAKHERDVLLVRCNTLCTRAQLKVIMKLIAFELPQITFYETIDGRR